MKILVQEEKTRRQIKSKSLREAETEPDNECVSEPYPASDAESSSLMESDYGSRYDFSSSSSDSEFDSESEMKSDPEIEKMIELEKLSTVQEIVEPASMKIVEQDSHTNKMGWTIVDCGSLLRKRVSKNTKYFVHWRPNIDGENCCFHYTDCCPEPEVCGLKSHHIHVSCCFLLTYSIVANGCRNFTKVIRRKSGVF